MEGVKDTVQLANTYGLGVVLSVINISALVGLVFWIVRTCHKEKLALGEIINKSISAMTVTVNQNAQAVAKQTEILHSLNEEVKERWESVRESSRYQREEHQMIMKAQQEILLQINRGV